ncbi:hypothetical protein D3C81_2153320 [compost metagenome]
MAVEDNVVLVNVNCVLNSVNTDVLDKLLVPLAVHTLPYLVTSDTQARYLGDVRFGGLLFEFCIHLTAS